EIAQEILQWFGVTVTLAGNGVEALEILRDQGANEFDAVLMDLQMPEMDGFTATREIRKLKSKVKDIPIIAMTAHAMPEEREKCFRAGMNDHVAKPIEINQLVDTLVHWIGPIPKERAEMAAAQSGDRQKNMNETGGVKNRRNLPGINERAGMKRLNNNRRLYLKLLSDLVRESEIMLDEIEGALSVDKSENARDIVHGLKGMAGNVSAVDMFTLAKRFERSLTQGRDEEWSDFLNALRDARELTAGSLAFLLGEEQAETGSQKELPPREHTEEERVNLTVFLAELASLLKRNNLKAKKKFTELKKYPELALCEVELRAMENAMEGLRFKEAIVILQKMCLTLDLDIKEIFHG
ncbi:MAG: response regulator, partial [Desulfobulbaceae bacterium]|nr:response regulator [Desulfobulbaceae bacterium]